MHWGQFKDLVSHMCVTGAVEASGSLTLEVKGSNHFGDNYFYLNNVKTFRENSINSLTCYVIFTNCILRRKVKFVSLHNVLRTVVSVLTPGAGFVHLSALAKFIS